MGSKTVPPPHNKGHATSGGKLSGSLIANRSWMRITLEKHPPCSLYASLPQIPALLERKVPWYPARHLVFVVQEQKNHKETIMSLLVKMLEQTNSFLRPQITHKFSRPWKHLSQLAQESLHHVIPTTSPTFKNLHPSPTARTLPIPSCPATSGKFEIPQSLSVGTEVHSEISSKRTNERVRRTNHTIVVALSPLCLRKHVRFGFFRLGHFECYCLTSHVDIGVA